MATLFHKQHLPWHARNEGWWGNSPVRFSSAELDLVVCREVPGSRTEIPG